MGEKVGLWKLELLTFFSCWRRGSPVWYIGRPRNAQRLVEPREKSGPNGDDRVNEPAKGIKSHGSVEHRTKT